ncbi:phospholipid/cholesterol/gamma-HCH transport system substrate-binding protein [Oceanospirillum multiglobuliferum]|uniref:Outer membrane lipid asymmetry maintenance protein MlaD n=1 Tax=Oceanospirillum multiglobuliferum TaxID=64969 RepID=A0A1T4KTX5_9GAMM|nr:outer membrane lipid asymmetry maintenance protein MlaD [Oceanospirillum multiglobuliferum]OPX54938.1 outer membrane lipid asymmetry maintenance protein MlaD [Oceanospirillum multiglobuliferum]SJZ45823.1 phospholipid/cholesterol/gamma-HCH transport system substrate-binding protein [Oceanospirillum multiglobuliferum]
MSTRWIEISVGAFVIAAGLALLVLAFKVSGLDYSSSSEQSYKVYAHFSNVGGLKPRAKVTMAGVTVGRVASIEIDPKWYDAKVTLLIDNQMRNKLSTDTSAAILTSGLLGENYIGLVVGAEEETIGENGEIRDTQPALVLEDLIGKFLSSMGKN